MLGAAPGKEVSPTPEPPGPPAKPGQPGRRIPTQPFGNPFSRGGAAAPPPAKKPGRLDWGTVPDATTPKAPASAAPKAAAPLSSLLPDPGQSPPDAFDIDLSDPEPGASPDAFDVEPTPPAAAGEFDIELTSTQPVEPSIDFGSDVRPTEQVKQVNLRDFSPTPTQPVVTPALSRVAPESRGQAGLSPDLWVTPTGPLPGKEPPAGATSGWDSSSNPGLNIQAGRPGMGAAMDLVASDLASAAGPSSNEERKEEAKTLLRGAKDLLDLDDHTGAMELIVKAQAVAPNDPEVLRMRETSERVLQTMLESKLGRLDRVPRVKLKEDEIIWLNLDHRAGFVLAQIDGSVTFEDLFSVSGMSRLDTARILAQLVEEGVIVVG